MARGGAIYTELCFSCHGDDGRGTPVPGARAGVVMAPVAVRIVASQRTPRLRHQAAPARDVGTDRWQDLSTGHGADGLEHRSVGRGHRELRSQQLRKFLDVGKRGGRRARSSGHRQSKDAMDARRAGSVAAAAAVPDATWKVTASHNFGAEPRARSTTRAGRATRRSNRGCGCRLHCRSPPC